LIHVSELEARLFFFFILGTPSQEEHKTIFSGLMIDDTALCDKIVSIFPSSEDDLPEFRQLQNTTIRCRLCPVRRPYAVIC
jgi:hypothetical protein